MTELRAAGLAAVVSGQVAAVLAGILPWPLAVLGSLLLAGAVALAVTAPPHRHGALRTASSVLALACLGLALLGIGDNLATTLVVLLVGVAAASGLRWLTPVEVRTGLLCAVTLLVSSAAYARDVLVAPALVLGWVAVLVAAMRLPWLRARTEQGVVLPAAPRPSAWSARSAMPVALAVVLGLVAFLLLPQPGAPRLPLSDQAQGGAGGSSSGLDARQAFSSPVMDLTRQAGELSSTAVLEVPSDSPALWRSGVYDSYDGRSWAATERVVRQLPGPPYSLPGSGRDTRTDVVVTHGHDGTVWAPGPVRELGPARLPLAAADEEGTVRLAAPVPSYEVLSEIAPGVDDVVPGVGADPGGRWLQLPRSLPPRVRELAGRLTAGAATRADAVRAVEQWLEDNAEYSLDAPVAGPGEDAVDRFLFVDRVGFCQQFAAASAVLLRAAGIPARVVSGLGYGLDSGARRTYQVRHLHAWTEVYHPGAGWVAVDATPAGVLAEDGASTRDRLATWLSDVLRGLQDAVGGRIALAVLMLATVGAVALAVVLLRRRRVRRRQRPETGNSAVGLDERPALAAFLRLDARLGPKARRRSESIAEMRRRLAATPAVDEALGVVEQECYGPQPPPQGRQAAAVLDGTAAAELGPVRTR